jgi:2-oxoglutarate dehydrogenase E2 component (dihydrolipoamide succinyltransferase)
MAGALRCSDLQVKVPPLGESITDGVVASILKQSGDAIEEDEALLQIETDKVTVDVRAPVSGIVKQVLVKADDTVTVDHVVALIEEGEAPGRAEGEPPKEKKKERVAAAEPERGTATSSGKGQGSSVSGEVTAPGHQLPALNLNGKYSPKISFPRRRTADGQIISEMSHEEQERIRNDEIAARHSFLMLMRQRKVERAPLPPRRELSEKEMESIMLGGAE